MPVTKKAFFLLSATILFFLLLSVRMPRSSASDFSLTPSDIGQGEVGLVTIRQRGTRPEVTWMGKKIILLSDKSTGVWVGFVGADLTAKPGKYTLQARLSSDRKAHSIHATVAGRDRGVRRLRVSKKMAELDPETLKRVKKETGNIRQVFKRSAENPLWNGKWLRPVPGGVVSPFGCRTIINGMERSPHSGVDLKAQTGTPIKATNGGRVVLVAHHFFSGLSVVLDHGASALSMYFHLSQATVGVGHMVNKGDIIGLSGSSGRITGPHLHFGIRLNGGRIDPMQLIAVSGTLEQ